MQVECLEILFLCLVSSRVCYLLVFDLGGCGFIYLGEKFVLDMQFVVQLATHERCASRLMCSVVSELTSRAVNAYASTGADPDSMLPDDDWFLKTAQTALHKLQLAERKHQEERAYCNIPSSNSC
jgi:hypothetical protein